MFADSYFSWCNKSKCTFVGTCGTDSHSSVSVCLNNQPDVSNLCLKASGMIALVFVIVSSSIPQSTAYMRWRIAFRRILMFVPWRFRQWPVIVIGGSQGKGVGDAGSGFGWVISEKSSCGTMIWSRALFMNAKFEQWTEWNAVVLIYAIQTFMKWVDSPESHIEKHWIQSRTECCRKQSVLSSR